MARERTARVFVSSTFRDMHAERDHLVTVVFPELRERMQRLGLELFDVDLRWGIPRSGVDGERANPWEYCRKWIDRVEPFFICLLGQRYGWIPEEAELGDPAEREAGRGKSITELEIRRALFCEAHRRRAFFYVRGPRIPAGASAEALERFVEPGAEGRLAALEELARGAGRPVRRYPCRWNGSGFEDLDDLGRMVLEDLWSGLLRDPRFVPPGAWEEAVRDPEQRARLQGDDAAPLPDDLRRRLSAAARPVPTDPAQAETERMAEFATSRLRWFQGRERERAVLAAFGGELPPGASRLCLVRGAAGQGKSALLAWLSRELAGAGHLVITHFVGATEGSSGLRSMLARLGTELDRGGVPGPRRGEPPGDTEELARRLGERLESYAGPRRLVLILDGLDQLLGGQDAGWLPRTLGPGVRVVASCAGGGAPGSPAAIALAALEQRRPLTVDVSDLGPREIGEVVTRHLAEYCRVLDAEDAAAICAMPQARNPLYLMVLLQELRALGGDDMHRKVSGVIGELPRSRPDAAALFERFLERLELAFGKPEVRLWSSSLALARGGLASDELTAILSGAQGAEGGRAARLIERAFRPYLMLRPEAVSFFHRQVGEAVRRRYLTDAAERQRLHGHVADHLAARWSLPSRRALEELPFHLAGAGRMDELRSLLADLRYLSTRIEHGDVHALIDDHRLLAPEPGPELEAQRGFLRRHASRLLRYPASLFSLVQLEGPQGMRRRAEALLDAGAWTRPWLRTTPVPLAPEEIPTQPAPEAMDRLATCEVRSSTAALAPLARLAFVLLRLGEVGVVRIDEGRLLPGRVTVRRSRPLTLACSADGKALALAYEDGQGEVLGLEGEPGLPGMLQRQLAALRLRVPEVAGPALACAGDRLWSQAVDGSIRTLDLSSGEVETVTAPGPAGEELAAVVATPRWTVVALREPGGTRLLRLAPGGAPVELRLPGAEVNAACLLDGERLALALARRRLVTVNAAAGLTVEAEATLERIPVALAADGDRLLFLDDMARLGAWSPRGGARPVELGPAGPGTHQLAVAGDGTVLAVGPAGTTHSRWGGAATAPSREKILALFAHRGAARAVTDGNGRISVVDGETRRPVAGLDGSQRWSLFAQDGSGRVLLASFGSAEGLLVEPVGTGAPIPFRCPPRVAAVAGAPGEGFWLVDERGDLFRLGGDARCRLVRREEEEVQGGLALQAWPGLVVWLAYVLRGGDTVPRLCWLRAPPGALDPAPDAPPSRRHFTVSDGRLQAIAYHPSADRLATVWGRGPGIPARVRWGRPEELAASREQSAPCLLPEGAAAARFAARGDALWVLTGDRALLRLEVPGFTVTAALAPGEPFTGWDGTCASDELLLVHGEANVVRCLLQEVAP